DVTNLVMLETGHPLHAFDLKRFGSDEVVVRRAGAGERFTTLDNKEHELTPDVLLITNGKTGVAAGGVMGGLHSEVEDDTSEILLEAAYFNPKVIRRSRRELGMVSESSMRFEKGADPNGVPYAINRAAYLFQEVCGGEVLQGIVDCYPSEIHPKKIAFRPARCNKVLGTAISAEKMQQVFVGLEFRVEDGDTLDVTVPTFRPDIEREIDLIEEVVRIIGFEEIPDAITNIGPLYTPIHSDDAFCEKVQVVLAGAGFDEMLNHGLADERTAEFLCPGMPLLKITNPVSEELNVMRNSMVHTTLNVVEHNLAHRNLDLRLFELGKRYFPPNDKGEWLEEERLVLAVSGSTPGDWRDKPRVLDFYDLRGAIDQLGQHLSLGPIEFRPHKAGYLDDELAFTVELNGKTVGEAGRISKAVLDRLGLKQPVYVADLAVSPLIAASRRRAVFEPLPIYPSAPRDLSIVVAEHLKVGEIIDQVRATAGDLAESVEIFDLYTGKQIARGKKSIAFRISYRSSERNLSSEEVEQLQRVVVSMLEQNFNAEIRDN
ncbi:MAG: phenylalanine--tRNA ligase subunit beta, partial [candidate division Zixibacteria bacterium]|nr:phenylalanine--tRNA ligase subunit beta [candidate division Zixibacteria bacterium]